MLASIVKACSALVIALLFREGGFDAEFMKIGVIPPYQALKIYPYEYPIISLSVLISFLGDRVALLKYW